MCNAEYYSDRKNKFLHLQQHEKKKLEDMLPKISQAQNSQMLLGLM